MPGKVRPRPPPPRRPPGASSVPHSADVKVPSSAVCRQVGRTNDGICGHLDDNGQVAVGQTGRRRVSPRRPAAFLGQKEPQLVPSPAARAADAAIAAVATIAALAAAIVHFRSVNGPIGFIVRGAVRVAPAWQQPAPLYGLSPWALLLVALTTAPLAFRRTYPITAFWVILAAIIATSGSTRTTITFASVIFAAYSAVAYSPYRRLALVGVLFAAIVVTAAYPDTSPPVPARFGALLVLLPTVALGIAIRDWRRRLGESAERLRRAQ